VDVNRFEIDIDEIVVSGVPLSDVDAFGAALRTRLAVLAAEGTAGPWHGTALPELHLPAVPVRGERSFGAAVADALWRGLTTTGSAAGDGAAGDRGAAQ
jgi:hypothetical protein